MNDLNRTNEELLKELQELRKEHNELKALYGKDVNDRKQAEEALSTLTSRLQALLSAIPDIIVEVDKNKIYTWTNSAGLGFFGEDILGKEVAFYFEGEQETYRIVNPLFEGNEDVFKVASWQRRRDGEKRLLSWWCRVLKDDVGNVIGALSTARDITDRKKAEVALRESEERYRTIFENMGEGYGFVNEEETFVFANPSAEKIFGVGKGELTGICLSNFLPAENIEIIKNETQKRRQGESSTYELEIALKDGSKKIILVTATPSFEDKKFNGTFGIFRDITDRKKMEEALKESEAIHRNLVERMPDGVYKSTHDGKFVDVNPAMIKMLGYDSKEELLAIDIKKQLYFEPADRESLVLQEKLEEMGVYRVKKKDGSAIWVEDHGWYIMGENEEILFHEGITRDITERRQAEEELRTTRDYLENLITNANAPIIVWNSEFEITRFNYAFEYLSGYKADEVIGRRLDFLFPESSTKESLAEIANTSSGEHWESVEIPILRKDGQVRIALWNSAAIYEKGGKTIKATIAQGQDITTRKQVEGELELNNQKLNQANAEKDKFFSIVAHDLRSPFNSLLGFTELLDKELPTMSRDQIQQIAVTMRKSATNLYALLENLLEWSRLQRGLITFNPEPILLMPKVLADTVFVMESANKKEITLNYDIPDDLKVYADDNMLGGILRNLASNAIKFTPKGGKVNISAKSLDHTVECSVSDTGIGMNQEMKENLFNMDVNTSRKGTEKEPSTGLGLILCKEFVGKHGGKLWVESEKGRGSTFYFTLPNKKDKAPKQ